MANTVLETIYWFPVKGFPGIQLETSRLVAGAGIPNDRRFAITRGVESNGSWMPARSYYINARADGMLKFAINATSENELKISNPAGNSIVVSFNDNDSISKANEELADFIQHLAVDPELPVPKLIERRDGGSNWDFPDTPISIINAATVEEIGRNIGAQMDPLRYRGNLVIKGLPAWEEFSLMGKRIRIGETELEIMRPIARCPTPGVNPETGERDIDFESTMPRLYGHAYCGMYGLVVKSGKIAQNDPVEVIGDAEITASEALAEAEEIQRMPRKVKITTCEIQQGSTRMSLTKSGPWPLPEPRPGQRLRFHIGPDEWTSEYIVAVSPGYYHLEIDKSTTDDPLTEKLRTTYKVGDELIISGPFGRG